MTSSNRSDVRLDQLADAVSDGRPVDWHEERQRCGDEARDVLEQLSLLVRLREVLAPAGESTTAPQGQRWGQLQLLEKVGEGAFGEVFRAWDTVLEREVALKLSTPAFLDRSDRARAIHEARLLARVRHPNIATIYGADEFDGRLGIWMEFVNGRTLAQVIEQDGAMPVERACLHGIAVCRALSAVHRAGLLHRDVKAENVMIDEGGRIVLTDFGAGADESLGALRDRFAAGTPLYLAPEILAGGRATVQSEIYSVGVLLYRMVSGGYPVEAPDIASLRDRLAETWPPSWLMLARTRWPGNFSNVLERALATSPEARFPSVDALAAALAAGEEQGRAPLRARPVGGFERLAWVTACVAALFAGAWLMSPRAVAPPLASFTLSAPENGIFDSVAVSRDGREILAVVQKRDGTSALWLRRLHEEDFQPLSGTAGAAHPFWGPDGQSAGFFKDGRLKVLDFRTRAVMDMAPAPEPRGGAWLADGRLIFAGATNAGLSVVTRPGGPVQTITTIDAARQEVSHRWPTVIDDAHVVFVARATQRREDALWLLDVRSAERRALGPGRSSVSLLRNHLLTWRDGALVANALDLDGPGLLDPAVVLTDGVAFKFDRGELLAAASPSGTLVYRKGETTSSQLVWHDRSGRPLEPVSTPGVFRNFVLSPDGQFVAVDRLNPSTSTDDIWIIDLVRKAETRVTFNPDNEVDPAWSRDGSRLLFSTHADPVAGSGQPRIVERNGEGGVADPALFQGDLRGWVEDWSPDGKFVVIVAGEEGERDLWLVPVRDPARRAPLFADRYSRDEAQFSADGTLLAYGSNESGAPEVFVSRFPDVTTRWQVSTNGGAQPRWRGDGRELFFLDLEGRLMSVEVRPGRRPTFSAPRVLFRTPIVTSLTLDQFQPSRDGTRILLNVPREAPEASLLHVTHGWTRQ